MTNESIPSIWQRLTYLVIGDFGVGTTTRLVLAIIILVGMILSRNSSSVFQTAWTTAVVASYASILLLSSAVRNSLHQKNFIGYWEYSNKQESSSPAETAQFDQNEAVKRLVHIHQDQGRLVFEGYMPDDKSIRLFKSTKVHLTNFGSKSGDLFYWYESPAGAPKTRQFSGLVVIDWHKHHAAGPVMNMSGSYYGKASHSMGTVIYNRITKDKFEDSFKRY